MPGPDAPDWSQAPVTFAQPAAQELLVATPAGSTGILVAGVPDRSIVVTALSLAAAGINEWAVRDQVHCNVGHSGEPPLVTVGRLVISPGTPYHLPIIAPQASELPVGDDLTYSLSCMTGGGSCEVELIAVYYLV